MGQIERERKRESERERERESESESESKRVVNITGLGHGCGLCLGEHFVRIFLEFNMCETK